MITGSMTRKFKYDPPVISLVMGLIFLVSFFSTPNKVLFNKYEIEKWIDIITSTVWLVIGLMLVVHYIRQKVSGFIILTDMWVELPGFLIKSDKINLGEIRYVTQSSPEDDIIKISTTSGFYRFNKKYLKPADFEELKSILQQIAQANQASIAR
jgi:hypothetical protein